MKLKEYLKSIPACDPAIERDLPTAWAECQRGDWLLWLAEEMAGQPGWPSRDDVTLALCGRGLSPILNH